MKKALVSGGAGFIGSHLVGELVQSGYHVVILDNLSTGKVDNLKALPQDSFEMVNVDVSCYDGIKGYFKDVDYVFHLAALADIVPSIERPLDYHRANVDGTVCMLEAARASGVKKFVYAASSSCYGLPGSLPTVEGAKIDLQYPYALTKYAAEQFVFHWARVYRLPVISLRLFNVYGPRSRTSGTYGAVFGVFLAQKLSGKGLTIVGDGNQTRDFVFVKDVVRAFKMAAESDIDGEIFNVGSGRPQSINKLADLLGGEKVYIPKRPGEPDCTHADIKKIEMALSWSPKVPFEDGVGIMLDNIDSWRDAPVWTPESIKEQTNAWFKYLSR